jgi:hypothetical protein
MEEVERRLGSLERRIAILSRAVGLASLREVDLLRALGMVTDAAERDASELRQLMEEVEASEK